MIEFTLENVLAVIIILITANLLFIGFYIVSVLREVKNTVHKAGAVIDEVDKTVKDGIEKANAMQGPLQALATTASAFGGIIRTTGAIRKATQSILGAGENSNGIEAEVDGIVDGSEDQDSRTTKKKGFFRKPKFFKSKSTSG